jgi:two-component system C4-dicarboxylate transport response regulator DctD
VDEVGPRDLSEEAVAQLVAYPWPGNARELRNVLCSASAAAPGQCLERSDVLRAIERIGAGTTLASNPESLAEIVRYHAGNLSAAARSLGMPRTTLRDRISAVDAASALVRSQ